MIFLDVTEQVCVLKWVPCTNNENSNSARLRGHLSNSRVLLVVVGSDAARRLMPLDVILRIRISFHHRL